MFKAKVLIKIVVSPWVVLEKASALSLLYTCQ